MFLDLYFTHDLVYVFIYVSYLNPIFSVACTLFYESPCRLICLSVHLSIWQSVTLTCFCNSRLFEGPTVDMVTYRFACTRFVAISFFSPSINHQTILFRTNKQNKPLSCDTYYLVHHD